jgi:hypothetical protein
MGNNIQGQLGDGTNINRSVPVQISLGVVAAAAGLSHSTFIKSDGTLWTTGYNGYGQLGDGTYLERSSPVQIATGVIAATGGLAHSMYVALDGTLWAVGGNYYGQLGDGTTDSFYYRPIPIALGPLTVPLVPIGVAANTDASAQGIRISWKPSIGATAFEVWRNITNNPATATRIASKVPLGLFYDITAVSGPTYYYWIKAVNSAGVSNFSSSASGFMAIAPSNAVITITIQ